MIFAKGEETMSKCDRLEDLGRIREKIHQVLEDVDEKYGHLLSSKHAYEEFEKRINMDEGLDELHRFLRWHIERLEEIYVLACGNNE